MAQAQAGNTVYLNRLSLKNIRAFDDFTLNFADAEGKPRMRTLIIGRNGTNKTTLLRSIVLGVVAYPDAQSLLGMPNGKLVTTGKNEARVETGKIGSARILSLAFSPDGGILASAGSGENIYLWNFRDLDSEPKALKGHRHHECLTFSPNGNILASGATDTIYVWDMQNTAAEPKVLRGHFDIISSLAFSPNGEKLVSSSLDGSLILWNIHYPNIEQVDNAVTKPKKSEPYSVAINPDGKILASGEGDGTLRLLYLEDSDAEPVLLREHNSPILSIAFSPDGKILASGGADGTIRLWNLADLESTPVVLNIYEEVLYSIAFSPDGKILASGGADGTIRLWNPEEPELAPTELKGHKEVVYSIVFSPDGKTLASGSADGTIRLWNLADLENMPKVLQKPNNFITAIRTRQNDTREIVEGDIGNSNGGFIVAYGVSRNTTGPDFNRPYREYDSVQTLFRHDARLIGTELTLRRMKDSNLYERAMPGIKRALGLPEDAEFHLPQGGGVEVSGPGIGKSIPLEGWADGYRLTFQWIIDLYAWAMRAGQITEDGSIRGILLIDEIEQHLHPSLQTGLLDKLSDLFPELQIIATTHSPLVALGAKPEELVVLRREGDRVVAVQNVPDFRHYSVEDMVRDDLLFDSPVVSPALQQDLKEYHDLAQKAPEERSPEEETRLASLARQVTPPPEETDEVLQEIRQLREELKK